MKKVLLVLGSALAPALAFAQTPRFDYIESGVRQIFDIAARFVIPALTLAATAYFIWGIIEYIRAKDSAEKAKQRHALVQGVIALAVLVSVWGIVNLLQNVANIRPSNQTNTVCPPGYTAVGARCFP